ncbi:type VII secretion protein EccE [Krasilnikovia sp. MM14-A1259]|uniref:type VII secretion protein EccE n=1 Tax=Krasilnikovia sp. MM14-A1259 TaxID=3373539 RepID=UPI003830F3AD
MTTLADRHLPSETGVPDPSLQRQSRPGRGLLFGVRPGQLVGTQLAAVAALIGAAHGPFALAAGVALALFLLAASWLRMRGRWAFEWLAVALRFAGRCHAVPVDAAPTALLEFVAPGTHVEHMDLVGDPAALLVDAHGLTAVLELGDPGGLLAEDFPLLPAPGSLLPPSGAEHPPCRIQLVLTGVPAPTMRAGSGTAANSYRQLTEGRLLGHSRALLAVRVLHADGWSPTDLRQALSGLVRKLPKRLSPVPVRPLGAAAAIRTVAELAHDDGAGSAQESWSGLQIGGLSQATFRVHTWPEASHDTAPRLVARLLALPTTATTVALGAGPRGPLDGAATIDLTIRLAAADQASLGVAAQALRAALTAEGADAGRLDGEHLDGLAATLPLGGASNGPSATLPLSGAVNGRGATLPLGGARNSPRATLPLGGAANGRGATLPLGTAGTGQAANLSVGSAGTGSGDAVVTSRPTGVGHPATLADGLELTVAVAGLMLGTNRYGDPVVARLFRPEQTRVLLVGGVRCAQLVVLRAMALGARVIVQTARPQSWEPFVRGAAVPGESIALIPPGRAAEVPPGSALHPLLVVVDVGPVGADSRPGAGFQATLVVRDEVGPADVDVATRADLLVLQPLRPDEAAVLGPALGLGETAPLLTRIRADMVGIINRRAVRWVAVAQTPIEAQLIGPPDRG